jgi:hypothetical protein
MRWIYENPLSEGKYVVQTKTSKGKTNTMESHWTGKNWSFTNQVFYRYLQQRKRL